MPVLDIQNLKKGFLSPDGERTVIIDIERFSLEPGQQVALQGASGSGKTTLLHLIAGILKPDRGSIRIAGQEVSAFSEARRDQFRGRHVGYIFQTFNLLQGYTALENVELAMRFGRGAKRGVARQLLERVGLADRLNYRPRQLSVGQQQRVAVARALANRPELVLADEPTGNLDRRHARAAVELMREVCRENGAALLAVSHDPLVLSEIGEVRDLHQLNRAGAAHEAPRAAGAPA